jgi:hypothetical protein
VNELCPICAKPGKFLAHGVIAPWISALTNSKLSLTKYGYCYDCGLKYFYYRYSFDEIQKLYSSYRTGQYLVNRQSWEFWYGSKENDAYDPRINASKVQARRNLTDTIFAAAGIKRTFMTCVDFGGDLGQFFPDFAIGKRYLIDVSAAPSANDSFEVVSDIKLIKEPIDLILNCGVIEHLSELTDSIKSLSESLVGEGIMYIEVPLDDFRVSKFHRTNFYRRYLLMLLKSKRIFVALDFISGIVRLYTRRIPFFGIVKQSEHINYFNSKSLLALTSTVSKNIWLSPENREFRQGKLRMGHLAAIVTM